MTTVTRFWRLLSNLFRWRSLEADVAEEIRSYVDELTERQVSEGVERQTARRAAQLELGGIEPVRQRVREQWLGFWLRSLAQDVRYGLKGLLRSPAAAVVAVAVLGVGIGITTVQFTLLEAFFLRPLPFRAPDALVHLWSQDLQHDLPEMRVSYPNFLDFRAEATAFSGLGAYFYSTVNLERDGVARRESIGYMTSDMFGILGVEPVQGRTFSRDDEIDVTPGVVVIGERFWQREFGASADVIGRRIVLSGKPHIIVGVMPAEFEFPLREIQIWTPMTIPAETDRAAFGPLMVVGRLRDGVHFEEAQAEVGLIAKELELDHPVANQGRGARLVPLRQSLLFFYDQFEVLSGVLSAAVGFVLLIVCINVGTLIFSRSAKRTRELATRLALGASRGRIIRQLLTESAALAFLGAVVGLVLAAWMGTFIDALLPPAIYRSGSIGVGMAAFGFTLAVSAFVTLAAGLAPALQFTRPDVSAYLCGNTPRPSGIHGHWFQKLLVTSQSTLATMLLFAALSMFQLFMTIQDVDLGFDPQGVLTASLDVPVASYPDSESVEAFYRGVIAGIEALPGAEAVGTVNPLPLNFETAAQEFRINPADSDRLLARSFSVTPGFFEALRVPVLQGRTFTDGDSADAPRVAIVNRAWSQLYFPGQNIVGQTLYLRGSDDRFEAATVVGVVADSKSFLLNEGAVGQIYLSQAQVPDRRRFLVLRSQSDPFDLAANVADRVSEVDPLVALADVRSMDQVVDRVTGVIGLPAVILTGMGGGALFLAMLGLYGVISFLVSERQREIGIRIAMGASQRAVFGRFVGEGVRVAGFGIGLGLLMGLALGRLAARLGAAPAGTAVASSTGLFLAFALLLVGSVLVASGLPARRAARMDPVATLRHD